MCILVYISVYVFSWTRNTIFLGWFPLLPIELLKSKKDFKTAMQCWWIRRFIEKKNAPAGVSIAPEGRKGGMIFLVWLVVGPPLWKIWKSIGMMIVPNIWENKKWQPNHQPAV